MFYERSSFLVSSTCYNNLKINRVNVKTSKNHLELFSDYNYNVTDIAGYNSHDLQNLLHM